LTAEIESKKKEGEVIEQQLQKTTEVILPKETLEAFGGDELRSRVFY
jgi:hypothetical protein